MLADMDENANDEQHAQKINGRVAQLEAEVASLQRRLAKEKAEHDKLKDQHHYRHSPHSLVDDPLPSHVIHNTEEHLAEELHKMKLHNDQLTAQVAELKKPRIPPKLMDSFQKFVHRTGIPVELTLHEHQTVEKCCAALKEAAKSMFTMKKQVEAAPPPGTESELAVKVKNLQEELRLALHAAEDIRALRGKMMQMIERVRLEKEGKLRAEQESASFRKKTEMLGDHMEKLMAHLRHESAAKTRLIKQLQEEGELNRQLKANYALLLKKNASKDRFILEMHEGSKVLEDQLRLMDEKYLDLRSKLDWAREYANKKLAKSEKTAADLRAKFTMLTGSNVLLDNAGMPHGMGSGSSMMSGGGGYGGDGSVDFNDGASLGSLSMGGGSTKSAGRRHGGKHSSASASGKRLQPLSQSGSGSLQSTAGGDLHGPHHSQKEPDIDSVLNKIRRKQHQQNNTQREWTEESMRELVKSH